MRPNLAAVLCIRAPVPLLPPSLLPDARRCGHTARMRTCEACGRPPSASISTQGAYNTSCRPPCGRLQCCGCGHTARRTWVCRRNPSVSTQNASCTFVVTAVAWKMIGVGFRELAAAVFKLQIIFQDKAFSQILDDDI